MTIDDILSEKVLESNNIYNDKPHNQIREYLHCFLKSKFPILKENLVSVECQDHGIEKLTIMNEGQSGMHGFCLGNKFGDWRNTMTFHCKTQIACGRETEMGFNFVFQYKDLPKYFERLRNMPDEEFLKGFRFDDNNYLNIFTFFMKTNLI